MKAHTLLMTVALLLTLGATQALADTNAQEVEDDNSIASDLVTPHQPWGKGWAAGPARTLYFVYTGPYDGTWEDTGTRVREVVELQQRFDLPGDAVLFCGKANAWVFHGLRDGEARAERLLEKPYDLYVIAGFDFGKLPAKIQYLILEKVARGAGLVCCGPRAQDFMVDKRKVSPTPLELAGGLPALDGKPAAAYMTAYRLGKGRGVWLNYAAHSIGPYHAFSWRGLTEYDYWMALAGRAALWAAGKANPLHVSAVNDDQPMTVDRAAGNGTVSAALANTGAQASTASVSVSLRRAEDGLKVDLGAAQATVRPDAESDVTMDLPVLRAGDYFVDVMARQGNRVQAFGAGNLTVTSAFGIEAVETSAKFVEPGDTITISASVRGDIPDVCTLEMRLRNSYDRIVAVQRFPVTADQTRFSMDWSPDEFATIELRAEAALIADGQEVEMKQAIFTVPKRRQGQFNFVMWDAPPDVLGYYTWRQLQEAGYNVCLQASFSRRPQPTALRAADATMAPYSTRILDPKDDKGYMQPVCWNDEPAVTEYVQGIVDNQTDLREQGIFVYSLGDEGVTKGCCQHPSCIASYREWLQGQYGTIERLNASWGSEYASFDEVNVLDPSDNMETQSRKGSFPRWYDREAFARFNLARFAGRFGTAYRGLDPLSLCGFEGTGGFGDDYDSILSFNTFYGPYPGIGDDIVRWAYARERVRSNWMGYSKTGDALSDAAWRMVMKDMNSIWYWMWSGIGSWRGYVRPTLDFWPAIDDVNDEMKPVREGLGDLLMKSAPVHSGIGIFYSLPSALSGQLENSGSFTTPETAHTVTLDLTYELGYDAKYLTGKMLADGELDNARFRVLLLPMTQALSESEAATIRQFVENGGTVIADVRPGMYDEHCKPVMPGLLDDLFGITRAGRGTPVAGDLSVDASLDGVAVKAAVPAAKVDADVKASTAQALGAVGETPVVLVNRVGEGRAVLLNFTASMGRTTEPAGAGARSLLKALYDLAGIEGVVKAADPSGGALPVTETRVWSNGDAKVVGLWRRMENAWFGPKSGTVAGQQQAARVTLPAAQYVYGLREGKLLGRTDRVDSKLRWGRPNFYLTLPYEITGVAVSLPAATPAPGQPFAASISLGVPADADEDFALWVEVLDPDGKAPLWGRRVIIADGAQAQAPLQVAYNDSPGKWTVRVTELFSGKSAEASWTVQ